MASTVWRAVSFLAAYGVVAAIVGASFFRSSDALFFDPVLNATYAPEEVIAAWAGVACFLLILALRRPWFAVCVTGLAFAFLKNHADDVPAVMVGDRSLMALVTGASSGVGQAVARELALQGHTVVMGCRSDHRCEVARRAIMEGARVPEGRLIPAAGMELSDLAQVRGFVDRLATVSDDGPVVFDLVIGNAGFMPRSATAKASGGWEAALGTMHVGHFALLDWMAERGLVTAAQTQVVMVGSDLMRIGGFHASILELEQGGEGDLRGEHTTGCEALPVCPPVTVEGFRNPTKGLPDDLDFGAYARAKLANALHARELERRGVVKRAVSVHPGMVYTNIVTLEYIGAIQNVLSPLFLRPPRVAANVVLSAAAAPGNEDMACRLGENSTDVPLDPWFHYFGGRGELLGARSLAFESAADLDALARRLWDVTKRHVGAAAASSTA